MPKTTLKLPRTVRPHEFDLLKLPAKPHMQMRCAVARDLPVVRSLLRKYIPAPTAPDDVVQYTRMRNRNNLMLFCREGEIVGVYAMLMLTPLGLERLLLGEFDPLDPDPASLALRLSTPAGIYQWAVVAPGSVSEGILHVSQFLRQPLYRHANLFARPATAAGKRICENVGFISLDDHITGLHRYVRIANRASAFARAA